MRKNTRGKTDFYQNKKELRAKEQQVLTQKHRSLFRRCFLAVLLFSIALPILATLVFGTAESAARFFAESWDNYPLLLISQICSILNTLIANTGSFLSFVAFIVCLKSFGFSNPTRYSLSTLAVLLFASPLLTLISLWWTLILIKLDLSILTKTALANSAPFYNLFTTWLVHLIILTCALVLGLLAFEKPSKKKTKIQKGKFVLKLKSAMISQLVFCIIVLCTFVAINAYIDFTYEEVVDLTLISQILIIPIIEIIISVSVMYLMGKKILLFICKKEGYPFKLNEKGKKLHTILQKNEDEAEEKEVADSENKYENDGKLDIDSSENRMVL